MRNEEQIHFLRDLEVQDLDTLDLASLAHSLHQGVHLASLPFRIAVFGPWGSGKTTVMRKVQHWLDTATEAKQTPRFGPEADEPMDEDAEPDRDAPFIKTLWFNPWEYESDSDLVLTLVKVIASMIPDGVRYSRKGTRVVRQAVESVRSLGRRFRTEPGRPKIEEKMRPPYEPELSEPDRLLTLRQSLRRLVSLSLSGSRRGQPRRLIVFVDDLDKCLPESVLTFLEGCKLFFANDTRIVFVFALDREVLSNAIAIKYGRGAGFDPERYIEKIFEFAFTVHPIQWQQIGTLVSDLYERSSLGREQAVDVQTEELETMELVLQRPGVMLNPRRIKRIFNKFIWFLSARQWFPRGSEYTLEQWLSWLLVSEYWREFRALVGRFGDEVMGELCNRVTGNLLFPHANEIVRQSFETLPGYRSLIEYFRHFFNNVGDMHAAETQARLKEMIDEFVFIDRALRAHGL